MKLMDFQLARRAPDAFGERESARGGLGREGRCPPQAPCTRLRRGTRLRWPRIRKGREQVQVGVVLHTPGPLKRKS